MAVNGSLKCDLVTIQFEGTDFYGQKFSIHLDPADAKNLLFRLHRIILEQAKMRQEVNEAHGGRVA